MNKHLIPIDPIVEYFDYRKFTNFLNNSYKLTLKNINPYEFFRITQSNIGSRKMYDKLISQFFKGNYSPLPQFKVSEDGFNRYTRFEDFTSKNEVHNISLWSLACLKNLSYDLDSRLGKELEIIQTNNPRDGRLDVAIMTNNHLLVLEAKVSLTSLLREGRFKYQIPAYYDEANKILKRHNSDNRKEIKITVLLIIGGEETDLYPPNHIDCTSGQVGMISKIFYDSVVKYNIKFISANALWALAASSEVLDRKIYWFDLFEKLFSDKQTLGLLSGGLVSNKNGQIEVVPLNI